MQNDPHYTAPEILQFEEPTKSSDVYSFSMIVYEILTKDKPFNHLKTVNEVFNEVVNKNGRPIFPQNDEIPIHYRELIEDCWSQNPDERPTFENIVYRLKFDQRFFCDSVRKEEFDEYVEFVEKSKEADQKQQKIEEIDSSECKIDETNESPNFEINDRKNSASSSSSTIQFESTQPRNKISESKPNEHVELSSQISTQKSIPQDQNKPANRPEEKTATKPSAASISQSHSNEETKKQKVDPSKESAASDLLAAYNEIRDDKSSTKWALAGFEEKSKDWIFYGKGEGGYDEMIENMRQDFIGFCYFRANSISRGINHPVFVIAKYLPNTAKMITKAHMNAKRGYVESIFKYSNFTIEATSLDDLSEEISKLKLNSKL